MRIREAIGRGLGGLISPILWEGSLIRGKRLFHPEGVVYLAEVRPLIADGDLGMLAQRLNGPALVRLSAGIGMSRAGREAMPDVLGVAIRFRASPEITAKASPGDQDLLFLSFKRLWLLPIAPFLTNTRDYLANDYYAQLPFEIEGIGRVEFRLLPMRVESGEGSRQEKLARAAMAGLAVLRLEMRAVGAKSWTSLVEVILREEANVDQEALRYDPFRAGLGIVPSGLLQATRLAAYTASYLGRRLAAKARVRPRR